MQSVASRHNCIFQKIDQGNDLGNDAYIEFVVSEAATGCCVFVQIKSGNSFLSTNGTVFRFSSSRQHFEYWSSHTLPVCAICYDPVSARAAWLDVTAFLKANPGIVESGPYTISIPASASFSVETFGTFRDHFLSYREQYRGDANFGIALERFSVLSDVDSCYDGLSALFSFHRNREASWFYIINAFRQFRGHPLLRHIVARLAHIPGHEDIYWTERNMIEKAVRDASELVIQTLFGRQEVVILLESLDENGFSRGTIGQCAHAIIDILDERERILEGIAFDHEADAEVEFQALLLLCYYKQMESRESALAVIERYLDQLPAGTHSSLAVELLWTVRNFGGFSMY